MARTRIGRSALALTLALVAVLAAIGVLAWFVVRARSARELERADKSKAEVPADVHADVAAESTPLEARSAEKGDAAGLGTPGSTAASTGTGTLRIRVLDEQTRIPVADLGFLVYRERGGDKDLARGMTDKDGRAEVREVEANTVLVRTERKPPYAESTGGAWLSAGATKELEILVGPGGAISGRVVDDLKQPVAGAGIYLNFSSRAVEPPDPDTRSGPDGRFRFESVASRPCAVWIVDGALRPERWDDVRLTATLDDVWATGSAHPSPDKDSDAGDIVLARASIYAGRVLDAGDRPVAGALVSLRTERLFARGNPGAMRERPEIAHGPADPEFKLLSRETLTEAAGQFELRADPEFLAIVVWTRNEQVQDFFMRGGKPGERTEGIELKLKGLTTLELELVDAAGTPAKIPAAFMLLAGLELPWRTGTRLVGKGVSAFARANDAGQARGQTASPDADGLWRIQLQMDPAAIGEIQVAASGYEPITERAESGFPALVRRRLVLRECPCFRLRLLPKDPAAKLLDPPGGSVQIHICMASPERHAGTTLNCCGLGARWNGDWRGDPLALVLPVLHKESFWIYARAQDSDPQKWYRYSDVASFGPFEPGSDERELALDPAAFARSAREQRKPPEASTPGGETAATLRGHVTDVRTGKGLSRAGLEFVEAGPSDPLSRKFWRNSKDDGDLADADMPAGRWDISIRMLGYKPATLPEREVRAGETLDLGTIALEPYAVHRGRVLGADGKPPKRAMLSVVDPSEPSAAGIGADDVQPDGSFRLFGDLPPKFVLQVLTTALRDGRGADVQRFVLESWPEDDVKELRLEPSRKLIVTVAGVDAEESPLRLAVCPAPGQPTSTCDHRAPVAKEHDPMLNSLEVDSSAVGQRYVFVLGPGRYQIYGANLMHELPWTELEVTPGDTDIELTITAH